MKREICAHFWKWKWRFSHLQNLWADPKHWKLWLDCIFLWFFQVRHIFFSLSIFLISYSWSSHGFTKRPMAAWSAFKWGNGNWSSICPLSDKKLSQVIFWVSYHPKGKINLILAPLKMPLCLLILILNTTIFLDGYHSWLGEASLKFKYMWYCLFCIRWG